MQNSSAIALFALLFAAINSTAGFTFTSNNQRSDLNCSNVDYSPCTCDENSMVACDQIPIKTLRSAFAKMAAHDLTGLKLTLSPAEKDLIPDDFLGQMNLAGDLIIYCRDSKRLRVSQKAFQHSAATITRVFIDGCDLGQQPNLSFMSRFNHMMALVIKNSKNFKSFKGLPSQSTALSYLYVTHSRGFEALAPDAVALPALRVLYLNFNQLNDASAAKLFKALAGSSVDSLTEIRLDENKLTKIPDAIKSLAKLEQLELGFNEIAVISKNSLPVNNTGTNGLAFSLQKNPIATIEPGAFGGNIGNSNYVKLQDINLTQLDPKIFKPVLQRMLIRSKKVLGRTPFLYLGNNAIKCDCHLAWLVRDNRNLLNYIEGAKCSDSRELIDLKADDFVRCK
ncbi:oplophorus-luciferin 2-monooxygenase non-catalytic subunit-like [Daphnia pulicaria]|uniref:oplophorus-luciferin 2-monooxygenase non-catalytic subunit-like n=1 Tax=Daphnia pulicaria TaxID=35523 RepID=UPI001EEB86A5|nr:oplophorus-luciferin 2-monooxygenase non-catalytic subunit-like [Daphnia pulicaria]